MTPVFVAMDLTRVSYAKNLLESAGIDCVIRNENTRTSGPSIAGYSSAHTLDPELCILDDSQLEAATEIIQSHMGTAPANAPDWLCPGCKESNPAAFDICWNCQAVKPES
jgi:hypothetical protein